MISFSFRFSSGDIYFDGFNGVRYESPVVNTKEFAQLCVSSDYYSQRALSDSAFVEMVQPVKQIDDRMSGIVSHKTVVSAKKYVFNPLSEPFHPARNIYTSSAARVSSDTTDCARVEVTSTRLQAPKPTTIEPLKKLPKAFVCILCPEKYATLNELKNHIRNKVQKPHTCFVCARAFEHDFLMRRHLKNHLNLKSFKCRGCSKKFRTLNQLNKHFECCRYKLYLYI